MNGEKRFADARVSCSELVCELQEASNTLYRVLDGQGRENEAFFLTVNFAELSRAFSAIKRVAGILEIGGDAAAAPISAAFTEYQTLLRKFRSRLPHYKELLLIERARVLARQSHSDALGDWAEINRQTR